MAQDTLLGFPAHTLPYRRGKFITLSTVSRKQPARSGRLLASFLWVRSPLRGQDFFSRPSRPVSFSPLSRVPAAESIRRIGTGHCRFQTVTSETAHAEDIQCFHVPHSLRRPGRHRLPVREPYLQFHIPQIQHPVQHRGGFAEGDGVLERIPPRLSVGFPRRMPSATPAAA